MAWQARPRLREQGDQDFGHPSSEPFVRIRRERNHPRRQLVELNLQGERQEDGHVLTRVEFPLATSTPHEILALRPQGARGKSAGDVIEVVIDGNQIFGPETSRWFSPIASTTSPRSMAGRHLHPMENDRVRSQLPLTHMDDETDARWQQSASGERGDLHRLEY